MKKLNQSEIKRIAADILFDFDSTCRNIGLRYSVAFGTMIGAVRHHGFIPWDDDIDVIMPREDYNILVREGPKYLKPYHKILSINEDIRFGAPLPKIIDTTTKLNQIGHISEKMNIGVYIDIFILDKIPSDNKIQKKIFNKCSIWQKAWRFTGNAPSHNNTWLLKIVRSLLNKTNFAVYFAKKLMNVDLITEKCDSQIYTILVYDVYGYEKNIQSIFDIEDCIDIEFEGHMVRMIRRYDEYLKTIYGDYMKLPPVEKQVTHHNFVAYIKQDFSE